MQYAQSSDAWLDPRGLGVLVMGTSGGGVLWAVRPGVNLEWQQWRPSVYGPDGRWESATAYDPVHRRGVMFGGQLGDGELGDLWVFALDDTDAVTWARVFPDGDTPSPRWGASMIYDPVRDRMVMFGGWEGRQATDTWELKLDPAPRWRRLPDRGFIPPGRIDAAVAYDSRRDAMFLIGGNAGSPRARALVSDTWELSFLDGDVWVPVTTLGSPPSPRASHRAIYDSRRDRLLVLWGRSYNGARSDCAELDLADGCTWRPYAPGGVAACSRADFAAVYDPARDQAIVLGGNDPDGTETYFQDALIGDFSGNPVTAPPAVHGPPLTVYGLAPNPTRDVIDLAFELPVDADAHGRIYDASGRLVRDMGRRRYVAGRHLLVWDGKNDAGAVPASGVYFARLSVLGKDFSGKFVLLR
jgi:hypothetical protein